MKPFRRTLYRVDYCLTPHEMIPHSAILIEGQEIVAVGGQSGFFEAPDIQPIEMPNVYAIPGFIDTHIHGAGGFDSTSAARFCSRFEQMCTTLAKHGVTSFMPTLISAPKAQMIESVQTLLALSKESFDGAEMVGIHLEGPFISPKKCGSQPLCDIIPIDLEFTQQLIDAAQGLIKIWTFAPELPHAVEFIECLCRNNIQPSMGHCVPSAEDVEKAIHAGARRVTHLYNGMPPLHQRNVNLAAIALTDDRLILDMILDGTHVNPVMVDLTCRTKKKSLIVAISDAIQGTGLEDGVYNLGNAQIHVRDGKSYTEGDILAGSAQTLETGWSRLVEYAKLPQTEAAACFTHNAAASIGLTDRGRLTPGKRADIVFYDKTTQEVVLTLVKGKVVFQK